MVECPLWICVIERVSKEVPCHQLPEVATSGFVSVKRVFIAKEVNTEEKGGGSV